MRKRRIALEVQDTVRAFIIFVAVWYIFLRDVAKSNIEGVLIFWPSGKHFDQLFKGLHQICVGKTECLWGGFYKVKSSRESLLLFYSVYTKQFYSSRGEWEIAGVNYDCTPPTLKIQP
jgi:hypothetical protein